MIATRKKPLGIHSNHAKATKKLSNQKQNTKTEDSLES